MDTARPLVLSIRLLLLLDWAQSISVMHRERGSCWISRNHTGLSKDYRQSGITATGAVPKFGKGGRFQSSFKKIWEKNYLKFNLALINGRGVMIKFNVDPILILQMTIWCIIKILNIYHGLIQLSILLSVKVMQMWQNWFSNSWMYAIKISDPSY